LTSEDGAVRNVYFSCIGATGEYLTIMEALNDIIPYPNKQPVF